MAQAPALSDQDEDIHLERIRQLMEVDQEYLDPNLNLLKLAEKMNISRKHLSRIINETSGYNFTNFVNSYHVKKTCQLLKDKNLKDQFILALAFKAGFNSITTFNKSFKKFTTFKLQKNAFIK